MVRFKDNAGIKAWKFEVPGEDTEQKRQWQQAYEIAQSIGRIDSNFSSSIRSVKGAEVRFDGQAAEVKAHARRVVLPWVKRSPTLKSVFYFAAASMHEEDLEDLEKVTTSEIFDLFEAGETATIFGLIYLSKKIEDRVAPEEWGRISSMMQVHMEIGALVGENMPALGPGTGMLLGGMRCLGYGFLAAIDADKFKKYRRQMKKEGNLFDILYENEQWGCNHLQIASILVQSMGFGLSAGLGFGLGMAAIEAHSPKEWFLCLNDEAQCWQAALAWTECLHSLQDPPEFIPEDSPYCLTTEQLADLRKRAGAVLAKGSSFQWITKRSEDLPEELQIRLGVVFNDPEDEAAVFEELEESGDYVEI